MLKFLILSWKEWEAENEYEREERRQEGKEGEGVQGGSEKEGEQEGKHPPTGLGQEQRTHGKDDGRNNSMTCVGLLLLDKKHLKNDKSSSFQMLLSVIK